MMTLKASIHQLMQKQNLDPKACQQALNEMLAQNANQLQSAAFLVLLRSKMETADELLGLIHGLQEKMISVPVKQPVLDIVGTGGDLANTINISTGSAILAASCGVKVAKHGNCAVSSLTGSADVLNALGVNIHQSPHQIAESIDQIGIGFCFSPNFHPAFQTLRVLRKQLNIPTSLNLLGPLLNPTKPEHIILGTYDAGLLALLAKTLKSMGTVRSIVTHGCGLDEISAVGKTTLLEVSQSEIKQTEIYPELFGLSRCSIDDLKGGHAAENAQFILNVLTRVNTPKLKAIADTFILNAGIALYLYGSHSSIKHAIEQAHENLYNGSALSLLKRWVAFSHDFKE